MSQHTFSFSNNFDIVDNTVKISAESQSSTAHLNHISDINNNFGGMLEEPNLLDEHHLQELNAEIKSYLNSLKSIKKSLKKRYETNGLITPENNHENGDMESNLNGSNAICERTDEGHAVQANTSFNNTQDNKVRLLEDELCKKVQTIETLQKNINKQNDILAQYELKLGKLELSNSNLLNQLKQQADAMSLNLSSIDKNLAPKQVELANLRCDLTKVLDRVAGLEGLLGKLKQIRVKDQEAIANLTEAFENLKTENFKLTLENQSLNNKLNDLQKPKISDYRFDLKKPQTESLLEILANQEQFFKKFSGEVTLSSESASSLEELNNKLIEDKERLLLEISNLKLSLVRVNNDPQTKELKNQESDTRQALKEIDDKYYQDTFETIQKYERELERKENENNNLLEERNELRKRVKELEEYIRGISDKIKEENEKIQREKERLEKEKGTIKKKVEIQEKPEEIEEKKDQIVENKNGQLDIIDTFTPSSVSTKKDTPLVLPESLGIKKTKKNLSNPGPSRLSAVSICGICSMIIGKKENKPCKNCLTAVHVKCLKERGGDIDYILCTPCLERNKTMDTQFSDKMNLEQLFKCKQVEFAGK